MVAAEPDPAVMVDFCDSVLPGMLTEVCGVGRAQAVGIGEDVLARARSFAVLDAQAQQVLMAPFVEEVFDHEPPTSPLTTRAAVTVVVRNSMLEDAHTDGLLNSGGIQAITTTAVAPLSHLLAAGRRGLVTLDERNLFTGLRESYPRAWACLRALAETIGPGGRSTYHLPDAALPTLPEPAERAPAAPTSPTDERVSILSGIDPRFDPRLIDLLEAATTEQAVPWLSALSRVSRNFDKLLQALEYLLAHNATALTTNYMLRATDVWVRRSPFIKPISDDPDTCLGDSTGLTGTHKKTYLQIAKQFR